MLKIQKDIPYKETFKVFASFPKFSLKEKITPKFFVNSKEGSIHIAQIIKESIVEKQKKGQKFVMAIGTGRSPLLVYEELIRMHKQQNLSFKNVIVFQLDEYYPILRTDPQSYQNQLRKNFIDHIDILQENLHMLNGELPKEQIVKFCDNFERKIKEVGGIDLIVIGIGRTGHIGFNEPPAPSNSSTRLVYLNRLTRKDATGAFGCYEHVPKCAITMGIKTIKAIKKIIVMAWSQVKAPIVLKSIQGQSNFANNPISFLHDHPNIEFYLDRAAGQKLSRFSTPWIMKGDLQDPYVPRTKYWLVKCVLWLSEILNKPILRLTRDDYEDNGLAPIMMDVAEGNVQDLNLFVYKHMKQVITGWPLGDRPNQFVRSENPLRIHKKSVLSENVLIFSPHPDDDVISMGGTFCKLVKQGHHVSVAYMTSGSNAVHDYDSKKYLYFLKDFTKELKKEYQSEQNPDSDILKCFQEYEKQISRTQQLLNSKDKFNRQDCQPIIDTKRIIRVSQAKIAVNSLGLPSKNTYSLSLPFYGRNLKKVDISNDDYQIIRDLLRLTQPSIIYAAGDLTDPHGTHRKCLEILLHVIDQQHEKKRKDHNYKSLVPSDTRIFLYRGAWEEWDLAMANYLIVLSPLESIEKQQAILHHQSQRDPPMFAGDDDRQFWLRAKQRNRSTAQKLNTIGFPDYEAVQCFVDLKTLRSYDDI